MFMCLVREGIQLALFFISEKVAVDMGVKLQMIWLHSVS